MVDQMPNRHEDTDGEKRENGTEYVSRRHVIDTTECLFPSAFCCCYCFRSQRKRRRRMSWTTKERHVSKWEAETVRGGTNQNLLLLPNDMLCTWMCRWMNVIPGRKQSLKLTQRNRETERERERDGNRKREMETEVETCDLQTHQSCFTHGYWQGTKHKHTYRNTVKERRTGEKEIRTHTLTESSMEIVNPVANIVMMFEWHTLSWLCFLVPLCEWTTTTQKVSETGTKYTWTAVKPNRERERERESLETEKKAPKPRDSRKSFCLLVFHHPYSKSSRFLNIVVIVKSSSSSSS